MTTVISGTTGIDRVQGGVVGHGPAFAAASDAGNLTVTGDLQLNNLVANTEAFDSAGAYSTSTGRFTPQVAGYYQVNLAVTYGVTSIVATVVGAVIVKNGTPVSRAYTPCPVAGYPTPSTGALVYLNGTTDYINAGAIQNSGSSYTTAAVQHFSACLVRAT